LTIQLVKLGFFSPIDGDSKVSLLLAGIVSPLVDDGISLFLWVDELDFFVDYSVRKKYNLFNFNKKFATMVMILESTKLIFKIISNLFDSLQSECVFPSLQ